MLDKRRYEQRAKIIKALAHPSRLLMVDALAEGERCVCELQELVGADISTVSKHLALMREAGLVADSKQGLKVFYRLQVPCILNFFGCIDAVERNLSTRGGRELGAAKAAAEPQERT